MHVLQAPMSIIFIWPNHDDFLKKFSFSFLHWNISSFVHFIIFCRSKYGFRVKLFLHVRFLSQAQKLFLYIVFCFKLCVLKKVLNTEINGKSDILVDHEFHMVSFSRGYVHVYNLIYVLWKLKH